MLQLLDDPDKDVYSVIADKILNYGKEIIPNLESLWETTMDTELQDRIETIIHKVNFNDVYVSFEKWFNSDYPLLLDGAILLGKYRFPDLDENIIRKTIKSIYQSCWLELTNYLTPLEQINIFNSVFYSMYKFKGFDLEENKPNHFYINEVIESRNGNNYSLGLLYQVLCSMLDLSVFAIQLPRQYLLAYVDNTEDFFISTHDSQTIKIQFYIDPNNGTIYSQNDVDAYIKKYNLEISENHFLPLSVKDVMFSNIEALSQVYEQLEETEKRDELLKILDLRDSTI